MPVFAVMGVQFFEGSEAWARGNAVHIKQQSEALAHQAALVSPGIAEDMSSWFGAFEVDIETGDLTLVEAWHLDKNANVKQGLPTDEEESSPGGGDGGGGEPSPTHPTWQTWSGNNADLYQVGDIVTHNGQDWIATVGNNHWEPGVYGWDVYTG